MGQLYDTPRDRLIFFLNIQKNHLRTQKMRISRLPTLSVRPFFPWFFSPWEFPGGPESHRSFVQRHPGLAATHHGAQGGCQLRGLARHVRQLPKADGIRGDMQRGVGNVPETWRRWLVNEY